LLDIIILCPIIYLDYFWCIKYQYMHKYVKIGKRNGKRVFSASWAGGEISAQPAHQRGTGRGRRCGRGPTCQRGGEGMALGG
jgi:hypothetical protein